MMMFTLSMCPTYIYVCIGMYMCIKKTTKFACFCVAEVHVYIFMIDAFVTHIVHVHVSCDKEGMMLFVQRSKCLEV